MTGVVVRLSDVQPERITWLWPNRLARGKLHVLDGDPGVGKSTISLALIACVTTGKPWPDHQAGGDPAGAVILSAEDGLADTIRPRLDAHGADCARVAALTGVQRWTESRGGKDEGPHVDLPHLLDVDAMKAAITEVGAHLVVIDPMSAYLPPGVDAYRDAEVRRALGPLVQLAEQSEAAVLVVRHLRKSGGKAVYAGGGSIGVIGAARIGLVAAVDPGDEQRNVLAVSKANIGAIAPALSYRVVSDEVHGCGRIEWLGGSDVTADDLTRERAGNEGAEEDQTERAAAGKWLLDVLGEGEDPWDKELPAAEVEKLAKGAGFSRRTLYRARDAVGVTTERDSTRRGRPAVWRHPDYVPPDDGTKPVARNTEAPDLQERLPDDLTCHTSERDTKPADKGTS